MITHTWKITKTDCRPQLDGKEYVIYTIHWELTASENEKQSTIVGVQNIDYKPEDTFTPFSELTEDKVVEILKNQMGDETVAILESNVNTQLANSEAVSSVSPNLPWSK